MNGAGRPLRFLVVVAVGWIGVRVAVLWPEGGTLPEAIEAAIPFPRIAQATGTVAVPPPLRAAALPQPVLARATSTVAAPPATSPFSLLPSPPRAVDPVRVQLALLNFVAFAPAVPIVAASSPIEAGAAARLGADAPRDLAATAWLLTRGGGQAGTGRLGDGQAGARVRMPVAAVGAVAIVGRVAAPLRGAGADAGVGVEWRPAGAPVAIVAERRIGLDGTRGGPALGAIGGVDAVPVAAGFAIEAYGQAGAVARAAIDPYADGAARVTRPVTMLGATRIALGIGAWGAAQREGERVDIGPSAVAVVPVGRRALRMSLDWRQRIAGDVAPGSGPALTIGADF